MKLALLTIAWFAVLALGQQPDTLSFYADRFGQHLVCGETYVVGVWTASQNPGSPWTVAGYDCPIRYDHAAVAYVRGAYAPGGTHPDPSPVEDANGVILFRGCPDSDGNMPTHEPLGWLWFRVLAGATCPVVLDVNDSWLLWTNCATHMSTWIGNGTLVFADASLLGDANGDGVVNAFDIDPFVAALVGNAPCPRCDMNCDGRVDAFDIDPFVARLVQCP